MAAADRVRVAHEDDGDRRGRSLGGAGVDGSRGHHDVDLEPDQLLRQGGEPIEASLGPAIFDRDVPAFDPAQIAEPLAEPVEGIRPHRRTVPQEPDPVDPPGSLRPDGEGGRDEAAGHGRQERSARAHRITSSARISRDWGSVIPSAFIALRLITISNFVGCSTRRSPGLAPLRILSTYTAARRYISVMLPP